MKFLIFGGTGFIGASLTKYINDNNSEVYSVSRSGGSYSLELDISKSSDFEKIDFKPDVIVNCASRIPIGKNNSNDPDYIRELFNTNVVGAVNICNWAVSHKVAKILNCSTLVTVKKPWPTPLLESSADLPQGSHLGYAMSKLCQEKLMNETIERSETKLIHLRLSSVYGRTMEQNGIIFKLLNTLQKNEDLLLTDANKTEFDFIHVRDVCKTIYKLSEQNNKNDLINLASGKPTSLMDLAVLLKELTNSSSMIYNTNTNREVFNASISTKILKMNIDSLFDSFIPLNKGLDSLINQTSI